MMDDELVLTGYCRAIDRSRMVVVEQEDGCVYADCAYPDCTHASVCPIAASITEKLRLPTE